MVSQDRDSILWEKRCPTGTSYGLHRNEVGSHRIECSILWEKWCPTGTSYGRHRNEVGSHRIETRYCERNGVPQERASVFTGTSYGLTGSRLDTVRETACHRNELRCSQERAMVSQDRDSILWEKWCPTGTSYGRHRNEVGSHRIETRYCERNGVPQERVMVSTGTRLGLTGSSARYCERNGVPQERVMVATGTR